MASAQIFVDFNDESSTLTEAGFIGVDSNNGAISNLSIGDGIFLSANAFGNAGGRDRGTTGLSGAANFFRDGFTGNNASGKEADFTFSGLSANTAYTIQFWTWDNSFNNNNVTIEFFNTTSGGNTSVGTVLLDGVRPASLSDKTTSFTISSDNAGAISLDVFAYPTGNPAGNTGLLANGFSITMVPEPSVIAAAFSACVIGLAIWRRRGL